MSPLPTPTMGMLVKAGALGLLYALGMAKGVIDERRCERDGHPGWSYHNDEAGNPNPTYKRCMRCRTEVRLDDVEVAK